MCVCVSLGNQPDRFEQNQPSRKHRTCFSLSTLLSSDSCLPGSPPSRWGGALLNASLSPAFFEHLINLCESWGSKPQADTGVPEPPTETRLCSSLCSVAVAHRDAGKSGCGASPVPVAVCTGERWSLHHHGRHVPRMCSVECAASSVLLPARCCLCCLEAHTSSHLLFRTVRT